MNLTHDVIHKIKLRTHSILKHGRNVKINPVSLCVIRTNQSTQSKALPAVHE